MRSVVDLYEPAVFEAPPGLRTRAEEASLIKTGAVFDVVVIGGSPAALYLSRLLALHELRCAVVVSGDFSYGGEEFVETPAMCGALLQRWKELDVVVGLMKSAHGAVVVSRSSARPPRGEAISLRILEMLRRLRRHPPLPGEGTIFCSWQRSRVVRELLVAARQEGCAALNHAGAIRAVPNGDEFFIALENNGLQRIRSGAVVEVVQTNEDSGWAMTRDRIYKASVVGLIDGILTAEEIVKEILSHLPGDSVFFPGRTRRWPGCREEELAEIIAQLTAEGAPEDLARKATTRFGSRAALLKMTPGGTKVDPSGEFLVGERSLVVADELALTEEDVCRRLDVVFHTAE